MSANSPSWHYAEAGRILAAVQKALDTLTEKSEELKEATPEDLAVINSGLSRAIAQADVHARLATVPDHIAYRAGAIQ